MSTPPRPTKPYPAAGDETGLHREKERRSLGRFLYLLIECGIAIGAFLALITEEYDKAAALYALLACMLISDRGA